jgi:hypothetical protein
LPAQLQSGQIKIIITSEMFIPHLVSLTLESFGSEQILVQIHTIANLIVIAFPLF